MSISSIAESRLRQPSLRDVSDFWGEWRTEGDTLTLTITGGNRLPAQSTYRGRYEVREKELVLYDIVLVGDFAGPTMIFTYERPADSKTV